MPKIRVLVVDDAVVMRKMISEVLTSQPDIEVVGSAPNGRIALAKIPQVNPDVITLDVEMPEMDGIATLREIRKTYPKLPVIMFSTLTQKGAITTLEALGAGASDYVTKPANIGSISEGIRRLETDLVPKIKAHCRQILPKESVAGLLTRENTRPPIALKKPLPPRSGPPGLVQALCIGTSTGGPNALADVFSLFPPTCEVPILIVQHMPPVFTQMLAERLNRLGRLHFCEAADGQPVEPNQAYLAPGGRHMEVVRNPQNRVQIRLHDGPPENSCRPSVDVLFRSVAAAYGRNSLGVIMTGMGQDGLRGCEFLREAGGQVLTQDEASSVVWGMPGYVTHAGLSDRVLPLREIADELVRRIRLGRASLPTAPGFAHPAPWQSTL